MGRPKAFDRDLALEKVMNEMWKNGYEACSVKALSEKLGITRSSFYNTFGSREELFFEVLEVYLKQCPDMALSDINENSSILYELSQVFKNVCKVRCDDQESRGCLAVNSVSLLIGTDENIGPLLEKAVQRRLESFEILLKMASDKGEIADEALEEKALALLNLIIGINVVAKVVHNEKDLWESTKLTLQGLGLFQDKP